MGGREFRFRKTKWDNYFGVKWYEPLKLPGNNISCMGTPFCHVMLLGLEWGDPLKLHGSHILHKDTSFLHVTITAEWDYFSLLPGIHIPCIGNSLLCVPLVGAEWEWCF